MKREDLDGKQLEWPRIWKRQKEMKLLVSLTCFTIYQS